MTIVVRPYLKGKGSVLRGKNRPYLKGKTTVPRGKGTVLQGKKDRTRREEIPYLKGRISVPGGKGIQANLFSTNQFKFAKVFYILLNNS
jgi:hypothetical protein